MGLSWQHRGSNVNNGTTTTASCCTLTVNTVTNGNKSQATIRWNVRFELDEENPESEINHELEPKRIQQSKIPSEAKTNGKPLNIIERKEEWN
jgi:hypothetical protein